jgi:SAM-dependent methyltransferase
MALRPILRDSYHWLYPQLLPLRFLWADLTAPRAGEKLPPARLRYRVSETLDRESFLNVGMMTADAVHTAAEAAPLPLSAGMRVLDFGCGCGRTLRWLTQLEPAVEWTGCDADGEAVAWCRQALPSVRFDHTQAMPPLPYAGESFDLVYAISVFTHLDHHRQEAWVRELARVMRPGGVLLLSMFHPSVAVALGAETELIREGFLFLSSKKARGVMPEWYQTALATPEHTAATLQTDFDVVGRREHALGDQDLVVARRKGAGAASQA